MTVQEAAGALSTLEKTLHAYQHAMSVLNYDGETVAPRRSAAGRGQTMAVLAEVVHGWITAPRTGEIIDTLLAGRDGLDEALVRRAELLKEDRDELTKVPADEYAAYQRLLSEAGAVWQFGDDRMVQVLRTRRPSAQHLEAMQAAVKDFVGDAPQSDDLTMLFIHYLG